jgi:hypothetical protein
VQPFVAVSGAGMDLNSITECGVAVSAYVLQGWLAVADVASVRPWMTVEIRL